MLFNEFIHLMEVIDNPEYNSSRMENIINHKGEYCENNIIISVSHMASIKRFYESTNEFNRVKIAGLINNSMKNIDKVYQLIVEYEKIKIQREYNNGK
jgi:putative lipoic acid-binding regulatory protein